MMIQPRHPSTKALQRVSEGVLRSDRDDAMKRARRPSRQTRVGEEKRGESLPWSHRYERIRHVHENQNPDPRNW